MVEEKFPEEGDFVICTVQAIRSFGAFVSLDEYDGKEGFIHVTEVAPGWLKYIRDYIHEGKKVVCKVLRVVPSKNQIDLSLKHVTEHHKREKIREWKNEQKARRLLEIVAKKMGKDVEYCYSNFGNDLIKKYGTLYNAFEACAFNTSEFTKKYSKCNWIDVFSKIAVENILPPRVTISGCLELTCGAEDGIIKLKETLMSIEKTDGVTVEVQYIGTPRYRIVVTAENYKIAEKELKKAAESAIKKIKGYKGAGKFYREERR